MAKDFSKATQPRKRKPTDAEIEKMMLDTPKVEKKPVKKAKKKEEREPPKSLYVGESIHLQAKKDALNKGFKTLRDYIEHLVIQASKEK